MGPGCGRKYEHKISRTKNNSVTDGSNSDMGYDSRCGASDSSERGISNNTSVAGDGSGPSHSRCCNHNTFRVSEAATSSPGQSLVPASVPHKTGQAGHHEQICLINALSARDKASSLCDFMTDHDIDIVTMTETCYVISLRIAGLTIIGYKFAHVPM